ncbi:MAG: hypothetical protein ACUVQT_03660 [bacterium]
MISLISDSDTIFKIDSIYCNYQPVEVDTDIMIGDFFFVPSENAVDTNGNQLKISGVKEFAFDIDQGFDQGLKLYITGEMEGVQVKGALSDQGSALPTRRISEIEKIRLELWTKNFYGGIGDLSLALPFGITDEIEGVRLGLSDQADNINFSYALHRGQYQRVEFDGDEGKQGPYFINGPVVYGSERVYLSDLINPPRLLKIDDDYNFDYEQGILNFTNKNIITRNSHIIIEFQKVTEDYLNVYQEADARYSVGGFSISGIFHRTYDDNNNPLSFCLTQSEIESLKISGDSSNVRHIYADTSSAGNYNLVDNYFVYAGEGNGNYLVTFFYMGEGKGDYIYDPQIKGFVYQGPNRGNYTPEKLLPLPKDEQFYGIGVTHKSGLTVQTFGSVVDRNRFSPFDDDDNIAKGYEINIDKKLNILSFTGEYINYDKGLYQPRGREGLDYSYEWNTADTLKELAQVKTNITPLTDLDIELGYGLLNRRYRRRTIFLKPLFLYLGYENVDTLDRFIAGFKKQFNKISCYLQYLNQEMNHFTDYRVFYNFTQEHAIGLSGNYERNNQGRIILTRLDFITKPLLFSGGHRLFYDTTLIFGNICLNINYRSFGLQGEAEQSQKYAQKRDEVYIKVPEGTGNYVYDPVTKTYIPKMNGNYIRQIILLQDFQRVTSQRYSLEPRFSRGILDFKGRFFYLDERNFFNRKEALNMTIKKDEQYLEVNFQEERSKDSRYALEPITQYQYQFFINPGYKKFYNYYGIDYKNERWGLLLKEERIDYSVAMDLEILEQPQVKPYAGYKYSKCFSEFFPALELVLQTPHAGLVLGRPIKNQGRVEMDGELLYHRYNILDVPYFFSANEPPGLTKIFTLNGSLGISNNTIFSLVYRIQWSPDDKPMQSLKFQARIRF